MKRREFISLLGGTAAVWPLAARAAAKYAGDWVPRPKIITRHRGPSARISRHVEGENVAVEYRWAENQNDQLPALAADLVRRQVTVITAPGSTPAALAAQAATTTIPIVFGTSADPVQLGLVTSLNRPGGNITGVATLSVEVGAKRLELLHEVVPTATTVALLINPASPALSEPTTRDLQAAARVLGLNIHILDASTELDFERVFVSLRQLQTGGLVIGTDPLFTARAKELGAFSFRHRVPAIFQLPEFTAAGGLMSYGGSISDAYHRVGVYVGRILKGEKPADMPVQQSTKVQLVINLRTAKALGITFPITLLGRADEVIE